MRDAAATIDRIANRVHGNAAALSNLERERLRQQTRANNEAVKADNAAEEITRLRAELATMTERAEAEYAGRQASDDMVHDYGKRLDEELANLSAARADLAAMRVESSNHAAAAETARMERDAALADLDAAMALLREIRNTSGIGLNCGIYERMGFADKSTLERIEAMLEKAEKP
jgi:chromosome segregation ATPase